MLFRSFIVVVALAIALGGGAYSAWYAVNDFDGFGALKAGDWTAYPLEGTHEADPYSRARTAREGALPLGSAEGIAFYAYADHRGEPLMRGCEYRIQGNSPPARFWTLHAADDALVPLIPRAGLPEALHSEEVIRRQDGTYVIAIGPKPRPGNWLAVQGSGPLALVMTLYDTPVTGDSGLIGVTLPSISRVACDA